MFRIKTKLMLIMAVFTLPVLVSAGECLTPLQATNRDKEDDEKGFATQVQADQGQGSIDCSAFIGLGGPMQSISVNQNTLIGTVDEPIKWSVLEGQADVDVIYIGNSDGSRCTQFYSGNARSGYAGAGSKTNKDAILVACTDNQSEPEPPEPPTPPTPPITTINGECSGDDTKAFQAAIDGSEKFDWVIIGGRDTSSGGEGNTAICVDQQNTVGTNGVAAAAAEDTTGDIMTRCVERCITPDPATTGVLWYPLDADERKPGGICTGNGDVNGFFPIECRACELSSEVASDIFDPDTQFCWEQAQRAETGNEHFPNGSFTLPPPEQGEQSWTVKGRQGSRCYLISGATQSGYRYSYWAPSGCPN